MIKEFPDLPYWTFEMDEVSAGVYEVVGRSKFGDFISERGENLKEILDNCLKKARAL